MEKAIENLYEKLQDENLNLMVDHVNREGNVPYSKELRTNYVLLTKLGQMKRQVQQIPHLKY